MRQLKFTLPNHHHRLLGVLVEPDDKPASWRADYSIVTDCPTQNRVRSDLAILRKCGIGLYTLYNLVVTYHEPSRHFRLLAYTRNNPHHAAFLAGILYARRRLRRRRQKA